MAVSTYLQLTNKVLHQLNEVELTSTNFSTASGVYASVRDGINWSLNQINSLHFKWPFNFNEDQSQALTAGTELYSFPSGFSAVDWDSFYIVYSATTPVTNTVKLSYLDRKLYNRWYKEKDLNSLTTGLGKPYSVYSWYNKKFGITPSPDAAYTVKYNYWNVTTQLSAHGDSTTVPTEWDHVIVLGALYYAALFKSDVESSDRMENKFKESLKAMRNVLITEDLNMIDTVINFGQRSSAVFTDVGLY